MNDIVLQPSYWASVSGGKDSLYMLKLILSNPSIYKLDGVVHYELETDYPFIRSVISYMKSECEKRNIKFVILKPRVSWYEFYGRYGYPTRLFKWCCHRYKLDCKKQLQDFLKTQNLYLVSYVGLCADEVKRFKDDKFSVYPLVDFNICEDYILQWAKTQPIFNDYYIFNRRCGCICCPLSKIDNLVYTKKYYPDEYNHFMTLALRSEQDYCSRFHKDKFSCWQGNPKYDTEYMLKKVDSLSKQLTIFDFL